MRSCRRFASPTDWLCGNVKALLGHRTAVELGARRPVPAGRPTALIDGREIDVRTGHLDGEPPTVPPLV
jgi:hypothetical protein